MYGKMGKWENEKTGKWENGKENKSWIGIGQIGFYQSADHRLFPRFVAFNPIARQNKNACAVAGTHLTQFF
jgi:hypothetical protein